MSRWWKGGADPDEARGLAAANGVDLQMKWWTEVAVYVAVGVLVLTVVSMTGHG